MMPITTSSSMIVNARRLRWFMGGFLSSSHVTAYRPDRYA